MRRVLSYSTSVSGAQDDIERMMVVTAKNAIINSFRCFISLFFCILIECKDSKYFSKKQVCNIQKKLLSLQVKLGQVCFLEI